MNAAPAINWAPLASCGDPAYDPDWWMSTGAINKSIAIEICETCPVRKECLNEALTRGEEFGIWGGRDMRANPRSPKTCKRGHPRDTSMKVIGGTNRCEPCYTQQQRLVAARRAAEKAAQRAEQPALAPAH